MSTDLRRLLALVTATAAVVLAVAAPAVAHPVLRPDRIEPGTTTVMELIVPHGCSSDGSIPAGERGGFPTSLVAVQVPEGLTATGIPAGPWIVEATEDGFQWSSGPVGPDGVVTLQMEVTADADFQGSVRLPIFQACVEGAPFRWVTASTATPAPALGIGVDPEPIAGDEGGDSPLRWVLLGAGLAGMGLAGVVYARRRTPGPS
jgi:hypothetical protein